MSQFFEDKSYAHAFFCDDEKCSHLCLRGQRHPLLYYLHNREDRAIVLWVLEVVEEEYVSPALLRAPGLLK